MIVLIALLSIALILTVLTAGFTKGILSEKIYRPQNVYEEIWNLVLTEQHTGNQTVLTSSTNDTVVDFDFGYEFVGIHIPECNVTVGWESEGEELFFLFPLEHGEYAHYIYNYDTKTLFGDADFNYLIENFLTDYFEWCEESSDFTSGYSAESLGCFTFQYENPIYNRELSN